MGGALALHFGYRFCTDLAGVFAMSSFLNEKSSVYDVSGLNSFFLFYGFTLPRTVNCCSRLFSVFLWPHQSRLAGGGITFSTYLFIHPFFIHPFRCYQTCDAIF